MKQPRCEGSRLWAFDSRVKRIKSGSARCPFCGRFVALTEVNALRVHVVAGTRKAVRS